MFLFPLVQRDPSKVWPFLSAAFLEDCERPQEGCQRCGAS